MSRVKAIIPCCGLGTRIGMRPNQSKEMLIDPITGTYVIDYSLNLCQRFNLDPVIITRKSKTDLIEHVEDKAYDLIQVKDDFIEGKEWPHSVLATEEYWGKKNILILPDTRFRTIDKIDIMISQLEHTKYSLALHVVEDGTKWCVFRNGTLIEKPSESRERDWAFGLLGWKRSGGVHLFEGLTKRNEPVTLNNNYSVCFLDEFKDITRSKKIEEY